jgi:3-methyladenine DNA glycosylase AlkC
MAKKMKDYYDQSCAELLSKKIRSVYKPFNTKLFIKYIQEKIHEQEFLERQDSYVDAFEQFLTGSFTKDIELFALILGEELKTASGMFTLGWWLWPIGRYVERHGTKDFDVSVLFIYELTKRFTGEFAIRPLLELNPKKGMKVMLLWSQDSNVHVRRLSSEGMRPRLPWAKKSDIALKEYTHYRKVLTNLKDDTEKFVQKSVGNNLNDLMKVAPDRAMEIIESWEKDTQSSATRWIIKHGLRSVLKKNTGRASALTT